MGRVITAVTNLGRSTALRMVRKSVGDAIQLEVRSPFIIGLDGVDGGERLPE